MSKIKKFYKFMHNHSLGVIRFLYVTPIVVVVIDKYLKSNVFFKIAILLCCAMSLTIQIGNDQKWYLEEDVRHER